MKKNLQPLSDEGWSNRYVAECLEERRLLTAYGIKTLDLLGTNRTGGSPQSGVVMDAAGNLYGTTQTGGAYGAGTIYEVPKGSSVITTLASFNGTDGATPWSALTLDANGNLFGTTAAGGPYDTGVLYELPHNTSAVSVLWYPTGMVNGGNQPDIQQQLVADASGNLYGTIFNWGSGGEVFEIAHDTLAVHVLAVFSSGSPCGNLVVDSAGDVFGATDWGGTSNDGTLFEIPTNTSNVVTLANFTGANGANPVGGLVADSQGNLFGTTERGGAAGDGTLFELPKDSSSIVTLAGFGQTTGQAPTGPLIIDAAGNLYGTTSGGFLRINQNYPDGTIFRWAPADDGVTTLASFDTINGAAPLGGLLMDASGNLYGTTSAGTTAGQGSVFELPQGSSNVVTLAAFDPTTGTGVQNIVSDSSGDLFAAMGSGGSSNNGAIDEIVGGASTATTLASLDGADGSSPRDILIDSSGNLFGVASAGGAYGDGTVFELPYGGSQITTIASFDGSTTGGFPLALVIDASGNLYGETLDGGANGQGLVFEIPRGSSTISVRASMAGSSPIGNMIIDSKGDLFGTTRPNGSSNPILFELAAGSSTLATLQSFSSQDLPEGLTIDRSDNIYGTTDSTIFEIPSGGSFRRLATADGGIWGPPALDSNDNLYGRTQVGGTLRQGSIFELPRGASSVQMLAQLNGADGAGGVDALLAGTSGNLYGATFSGGVGTSSPAGSPTCGEGTFFELSPLPLTEAVALSSANPLLTLSCDVDGQDIDVTVGSVVGWLPIKDAAGLSVTGDSSNDVIQLDYSNGNPLPNTIHLNGTVTIAGLIGGGNPLAGTTIDLGSNLGTTVYLFYLSWNGDRVASVRADLQAGYNGGTWTGVPTSTTGVITSAAAALNPGRLAIGYADSLDPNSPNHVENSIELKTTVMGDANLDGTVNLGDFLALAGNFGKGSSWDQGDFNYDGSVNLADLLVLIRHFGQSLPPTLSATDLLLPSPTDPHRVAARRQL